MRSPLSVVVCDDNHDIADSLSMLLALSGHRVTTTYSGREALSAVKHGHPDVAFLDIGLPDIDGYQLARRIHSMPGLSLVRLIAITGYGSQDDKRKACDAGFNFHLTKPVDFPIIEGVLGAMT